jgi:formylglycine-generating enzyme required for sulfatase activity
MVEVPAGEFWMGCPLGQEKDCSSNMRPGRKVTLKAFRIDKTEVTVAAYGECVSAGKCSDDKIRGYARPRRGHASSKSCNWDNPERADHPINCVDYVQAAVYCEFAGKRLPTEAEWEKAARGSDPRPFPWGNDDPTCERVVMNAGRGGCGTLATFPVGSKPSGASPYGALDLSGNVREWVADWYDHAFYQGGPVDNPTGPPRGSLRVARGGSWADAVSPLFHVATRAAYLPHARSPYMGFRCASSK